jgi:hypothetical protein
MRQQRGRSQSSFGGGYIRPHFLNDLQVARAAVQGVGEGLEGDSVTGKEPPIEIYQAQETLQLLDILWHRQLDQSVHMLAQWGDAIGGDMMAEEIDLCRRKHTLLWIDLEPIEVQQLEKLAKVLVVLLEGTAGE